MLVCLCKGVSEGVVRRLVRDGATSLGAVMAGCAAGSDCGACVCTLAQVIGEECDAAGAGPAPAAADRSPRETGG